MLVWCMLFFSWNFYANKRVKGVLVFVLACGWLLNATAGFTQPRWTPAFRTTSGRRSGSKHSTYLLHTFAARTMKMTSLASTIHATGALSSRAPARTCSSTQLPLSGTQVTYLFDLFAHEAKQSNQGTCSIQFSFPLRRFIHLLVHEPS